MPRLIEVLLTPNKATNFCLYTKTKLWDEYNIHGRNMNYV